MSVNATTLDTLATRLASSNGRLASVLWRQARRIDLKQPALSREQLEADALQAFNMEWRTACFQLPKPRTGAENVARVRNLTKQRAQLEAQLAEVFATRDPHEWPVNAGAVVRAHVVARR
jgi:hypothetical protein